MSEQTPGERYEAALAKLKAAAAELGVTATAQGAFGWMMRGDLEEARTVLGQAAAGAAGGGVDRGGCTVRARRRGCGDIVRTGM